jgi:predicted nucleic acid-binding protein
LPGVYFADSFYWIALAYPRDAWHQHTLRWQEANPKAQYVTTEEVLAEVLTWFAARGSMWRAVAARSVHGIIANPNVRLLPQTSAGFHDALTLYEQRPDKNYSLTDCRSMVAMRSLALQDILSNDHHFAQEGFTVLFP